MGVKKSVVCRSRPPPNGMNPASSRVSIPLRKPSAGPGASPLSTYSRSPGANLEAQPALEEYFVSLMRVRSSIAAEYNLLTRRLEWGALFKDVGCACSMQPKRSPVETRTRQSTGATLDIQSFRPLRHAFQDEVWSERRFCTRMAPSGLDKDAAEARGLRSAHVWLGVVP